MRAVFFDAVGTLLHPEPSAGSAYVEIGRRFGTQLDPGEVRRRFGLAFQDEEQADAARDYRTDEPRELRRWRSIVATVLDDLQNPEGCFQALYEHFARPTAWRLEPWAPELLLQLRRAGLAVGVASNFDHRLRQVLAGLPSLPPLDHLLISSEVGWKKPARPFYARLLQQARLEPEQVLFVGDDLENDHAGARAAGLHALLLDPNGQSGVQPEERIASLSELMFGSA